MRALGNVLRVNEVRGICRHWHGSSASSCVAEDTDLRCLQVVGTVYSDAHWCQLQNYPNNSCRHHPQILSSFDKILCLHMKLLGRHARFYHARTVHKQKKFQSLPEPDLDRFDVGNLESAYIFHGWMVREFYWQGDDYMCFHALLNFSGGDLCA
jgi:hypothetical protein